MITLKHEAAAPATSTLPHSPWPLGLKRKEIQYRLQAVPTDETLAAWKEKRLLHGCMDTNSILKFNQIFFSFFSKGLRV